jgi:hypothetical protein
MLGACGALQGLVKDFDLHRQPFGERTTEADAP